MKPKAMIAKSYMRQWKSRIMILELTREKSRSFHIAMSIIAYGYLVSHTTNEAMSKRPMMSSTSTYGVFQPCGASLARLPTVSKTVHMIDKIHIPQSRTKQANTHNRHPRPRKIKPPKRLIIKLLLRRHIARHRKARHNRNYKIHNRNQKEARPPIEDLRSQSRQNRSKHIPQRVPSRKSSKRFVFPGTWFFVYSAQHTLRRGNSSSGPDSQHTT
jgi:hypothetical protein